MKDRRIQKLVETFRSFLRSAGRKTDQDMKALAGLTLTDGTPVLEFLDSQPPAWREIEVKAIFECQRRGWSLHEANIQCMARELNK